ncbi:MAG TPA: hypothetical protein VIL20_14485 [Sandaracinaceae bacterium]
MRSTLLLALLCLTAPAAAQRPSQLVPELDSGLLSSLLLGRQAAVERCASRTDTRAYVAAVHARVSPGRAPSTLYDARIAVEVISRPRDHAFEACVRGAVRDALRHAPYAVSAASHARHTFRIAERQAPIERPAPAYSEHEVRRVLGAYSSSLQQCLEIAGVPEQVTLRVAVRPDGRLVLTSADLPPGASSRALGCLASRVSAMRVEGRPARTVTVVHTLGVRSRAYGRGSRPAW